MNWIEPDWPAPAKVRALSTTRDGGMSEGPYASLNLGSHVGDSLSAVDQNRALLRNAARLPHEPVWMDQVHGTRVLTLPLADGESKQADAAFTATAGQVCTVMTADCLPVLFCSTDGSQVAAAHAGWRGLCDGVLEKTVARFGVAPARLIAWMGPAIGPQVFEVGEEVRERFIQFNPAAAMAFQPHGDRYLANLYLLARQRLLAAGVGAIYGGDYCTYSDPERFFSFRRESETGRQASLIWIEE
ncbi:purine nucleoside phosphorylase YfiH [Plesiomonas shigelloides]|uniref:purine nucleoside phosphorylase YfiH n=1 Tax=Plesiomonas shigelloides TaxID=703 RepID=UPI0035D3FBD3